MSRIAVLLPVYSGDRPDYFKSALNSLKKQTKKFVDIVLLVDGPVNDEIDNIINSNKESFSKILRFKTNKGLAAVLNEGIEYCLDTDYEFMARMDADDISTPFRFERQYKYIKDHPRVDVLGGAIEEIDESGNLRNKKIFYPETHDECFDFFKKRDPVAHPAVIFRHRFFEKAGLYPEKYRKNQDTMLWFKGFQKGCHFANIPEVILQFRISDHFFKTRRSGLKRASQILKDRIIINRELDYGFKANMYAFGMFLLAIGPSFVRKWAYKVLR